MAKEPRDFTAGDIAREMEKRPDSLDHLRAQAEMERRRTRYMLISAIATSVSAMGAAIAAIAAAIVAPPCPWRARRLKRAGGFPSASPALYGGSGLRGKARGCTGR